MFRIASFLCLLCMSCAGLQQHVLIAEDAKTAHCYDLERRYQLWGGLAAGASAITVGGALTGVPLDDEKARLGVGISTAAIAAFGAAALFIRDDALSAYGEECEDLGSIGTSTITEE